MTMERRHVFILLAYKLTIRNNKLTGKNPSQKCLEIENRNFGLILNGLNSVITPLPHELQISRIQKLLPVSFENTHSKPSSSRTLRSYCSKESKEVTA